MSHTVTVKGKVTNIEAIRRACEQLGIGEPTKGDAKLYSETVNGIVVLLPGWRYPVVVDEETGAIKYDNYNGSWGKQDVLDEFLQTCVVEQAKLEAESLGYFCLDQVKLENGAVKLILGVS